MARLSTPLYDCLGRSVTSSGARLSSTWGSRPKRWSSVFVSRRVASAMAVRSSSGSGCASGIALRDAPEQEAADEGGERRRRDGVLLRLRAHLDRRRVGAVRAGLAGAAHHLGLLLRDVALDLGDLVLRAGLDVGLLGQRGDRVAQALARALDLVAQLLRGLRGRLRRGGRRVADGRLLRDAALVYCSRADCARVFTHRTSSFVVSTACSGIAGVASLTFDLPRRASTPAIAPYTTVTISAATQPGRNVARARMIVAVSAPTAYRPNTPAPPNMPAPMPAFLPFSWSSSFASSTSIRASVVV